VNRIHTNLLPWLALPLIAASLLGVTPRSHEAAALLRRANILIKDEAHAGASAALAEAARLLPARSGLWESAGTEALAAGDHVAALVYLLTAGLQDGLSAQGHAALGGAYLLSGQPEQAIEVLHAGLSQYPGTAAIHRVIADAYLAAGDPGSAAQSLRAYTELAPTDTDSRYRLALVLAFVAPAEAVSQLSQAAELDPALRPEVDAVLAALRDGDLVGDPSYQLVLVGQALAGLGEWPLASQAFLRATQLDPGYPEAWAYLGEAREQIGGDGYPALRQALALDRTSLAANLLMSLYHRRQGKLEVALVYLQRAAVLDAGNPTLQAEVAALFVQIGDLPSALEWYAQAVEAAPGEPAGWRALAAFSIENEIQVGEVGLPAAQRLLELRPGDPAAMVLLGRAHLLLGQNEEAQEFLTLAVETNQTYAPAHLYLGLLFLDTGRTEEARAYFLSALQLDPGGPTGLQAERLLDRFFP
jgi:tetratricopeptide (TPR) repeat protein